MLQCAVNSTASRQFLCPNETSVCSPAGESANVTSVPIHSAGPAVQRQRTLWLGVSSATSKAIVPSSSPEGERKRICKLPPSLDCPVVSLVHQPETPST